jgi:hypothetical protein
MPNIFKKYTGVSIMARLNTPRHLHSQTLMFDEIHWAVSDEVEMGFGTSPSQIRGAPAGNRSGVVSEDDDHTPIEASRPPYWEFDYVVDSNLGLRLSDVNVRDTYAVSAQEEVFEFIEYTDLEVEFTDGTVVPFDISTALGSGTTTLFVAENGTRTTVTPNDPLYQRGLKLTMTYNILTSSGGTCNITLQMSAVFRGAANDFDPGGVPVALDLWPQLAYSWSNSGATKTVKRFRGTVRYLLHNKMSPLGDMTVLDANVPGYYTDSNTSFDDGRADDDTIRAWVASWNGDPFGWRMVFDYLTANFTQEKEVVGIYGPDDGNKYIQSSTRLRLLEYHYPVSSPWRVIVSKKDRQGDYDNVHVHAKMVDDGCGNVPVHSPFCGHSCVHLHWRWGPVAVTGAEGGRGWQFKGWSQSWRRGGAITGQAYSLNGGPLIPPNQRLMHAITTPTRTRFNHDHIINTASPGSLDPLRKLNWYCVDILDPDANRKQVIFEQGIGWAYRYATPDESAPVSGLQTAVNDSLPGAPNQMQMAQFFNHVYEVFRYFNGLITHVPNCTDQVPNGRYSTSRGLTGTVPAGTAMEDL